MKIIIPMAGMGKRMRPHTLTLPKPLIPVAGKTIVERLVMSISEMTDEKIEEVAFVIGDFGKETEEHLLKIAENIGAQGKIYYQDVPLGTGHAILCAEPSLSGHVIVAFADTLFDADFKLDKNEDGVIWVKQIEDPSQFGVVNTDEEGIITQFIEKPKEFISDLAIIGIYYFKDGDLLKNELQYLVDQNVIKGGEYQLTDAMENMKNKGLRLKVGQVGQWMDCGNKDATVDTNSRILELRQGKEKFVDDSLEAVNSQIIEPCFIGKNVLIKNSIIGPNVSIGDNAQIEGSVISNSLIMNHVILRNINCDNSMIGNHVELVSKAKDLNVGDYSKIYD